MINSLSVYLFCMAASSREAEFMKIISYDEASRKVTVIGRFDPEKLSKKLKSKGRKVIESVEVVKEESGANDLNVAVATAPPPAWCCWPSHGRDCRCCCSCGRVVAYGVPICCHVPHNAAYFYHEDPSAACSVM